METYHKNNRENFVLADMHYNGVYFDPKILQESKNKGKAIIPDNEKN